MNLLLEAFGLFCIVFVIVYVGWNLLLKFYKVKDEDH